MRVEIDQKRSLTAFGDGGGQVDGRGGFSDAALLIGDREDRGHDLKFLINTAQSGKSSATPSQ